MTIRTNALRGGVWLFGAVTLIGAIPAVASAQGAGAPSPPVVTTADYARAETMLAAVVNRLVVGGTVNATWLADDRFTYRATTADGFEFLMVDPVKRSRTRAFDHERLGAALAMASGAKVDAKRLPFQTIELSTDGATVSFSFDRKRYTCDARGSECHVDASRDANAVVSPDGPIPGLADVGGERRISHSFSSVHRMLTLLADFRTEFRAVASYYASPRVGHGSQVSWLAWAFALRLGEPSPGSRRTHQLTPLPQAGRWRRDWTTRNRPATKSPSV